MFFFDYQKRLNNLNFKIVSFFSHAQTTFTKDLELLNRITKFKV